MTGQDISEAGDNLQVVAEARRWLRTPYLHQASCRGAGCDCLGLIRGIWRALFEAEPETPPPYSMDWSEPQGEERLWQAALSHLVAKPLAQAALGDVLLFRMRAGAVAKHLGVQSRLSEACVTKPGFSSGSGSKPVSSQEGNWGPGFIHAYYGHGVVESALTAPWQRRLVARFSFPQEQI
ncbi:peptidase [Pseudophaeobacter arcticus]|jgi:NlpC/P60 family putative phage cell wall peptidase|uniref:peptidase n=1 Tax=Pseudophaeobacter arcticus TaxID=385492 RepID=UPI0039E55B1B